MRLHRLEVDHFGPILEARIELGPRLNVLDGPNDLGKSHLVQALRAVLLLPSTSTIAREWVPWGSDEKPRVLLDFETEPQRFWRVEKTFSADARGQAILRRSRDGEQWTTETKGRDVDGRLRGLLAWGIPEPGGSTRIRGLPETFLTQVVFPPQPTPDAIFRARLDEDPDETGREALQRALETLAQDPLFLAVLETAQEHVDQAFTATGRPSRARTSPFVEVQRKVQEAEREARQAREELKEAESVESELRDAEARSAEGAEEYDEARRDVERLQQARRATRELENAEAAVRDAEKLLQRVEATRRKRDDLEKEIVAREEAVSALRADLEAAKEARRAAKDALERATTGEGVARETQRIDGELLRVDRELHQLGIRLSRAEEAKMASRSAEQAKTELTRIRPELGTKREEQAQARRELALLRTQVAHRTYQDSQSALMELEEIDEEIRNIDRQLAACQLPDQERFEQLRCWHQELEVARARVAVGLQVEVELENPRPGRVVVDGGLTQDLVADSHLEFDAQRELELEWEGLGRWRIKAGEAAARRQLEEIEERWRRDVQPILQAAEVASFSLLSERVAESTAWRRARREHATRLATRLAGLGEADEGWRERLRARRDELRAQTIELGVEEPDHPPQRSTPLSQLQQAIRAAQEEQEDRAKQLREFATEEERWARAETEATKKLQDAQEELEGPWAAMLETAMLERNRLDQRKAQLKQERAELERRAKSAASEATARLREAKDHERTTQSKVDDVEKILAQERTDRDVALGGLREIEPQAREIKLGSLRETLEAARDRLGDERVSAEVLEDAQRILERRGEKHDELSREVQRHRGALQKVGGSVARERAKRAEEALEDARRREREVQVDAEAWRLLAETLREAEQRESSHLGEALVEPVSRRFGELTGGRYGDIGLDPDLQTTGLTAEGMLRQIDTLSQGLKEQLAALLRLTIAEQLKTFVVFDDHLAHTDPERLEWFRKVLHEHSAEAQVVVVTKRAEDFLGEPLDTDGQECRRIELSRRIRRAGHGAEGRSARTSSE